MIIIQWLNAKFKPKLLNLPRQSWRLKCFFVIYICPFCYCFCLICYLFTYPKAENIYSFWWIKEPILMTLYYSIIVSLSAIRNGIQKNTLCKQWKLPSYQSYDSLKISFQYKIVWFMPQFSTNQSFDASSFRTHLNGK